MLPHHKREEVKELKNNYVSVKEVPKPKYWGSIKLKPVPTVEEEVVDYWSLFETVLNAFEDSNVTWHIEQDNVEHGKINKIVPPPTPYMPDKKKLKNYISWREMEEKLKLQKYNN